MAWRVLITSLSEKINFSNIFRGSNFKCPGVYCTLHDSMQKTVSQLEELKLIPPTPSDCLTQLRVTIKDGMDGAGNQLKLKGYEGVSTSMELMGYIVLKVEDITNPVSDLKLTVLQ